MRILVWVDTYYYTSSLKPRLSVLDFVWQLWRKIGEKSAKSYKTKILNGKPKFEANIHPMALYNIDHITSPC